MIDDLLRALRDRGVELYVDEDALRFRAPKGAFTPDLRARVREKTAELVEHLRHAEAPAGAIPRVDRARPLRMSFGQERIWFLDRLEGPSSTYNITPIFRVRGPLSIDALTGAFATLTARHETLRMRFAETDGVGMQIVARSAEVPIALLSLRDRPESQRMAEAERIILEETARPFDLERGGLLRVTVIDLGPGDHLLLPFMHHIIADGWSLSVLQRELVLVYEALVAGRVHELEALPVQYPDFAAWQRAGQADGRGREALQWWLRELDGAPQTLALPLDFQRPPQVTFNGRVLRMTIHEPLVARVTALGREHGCSLFMILLAAYGVLLSQHSGQDDLLVGSPVAGRPRRELEGVIGCFVNTVVLRLKLDAQIPFTELLRRVRQTALDAYARQDVPVEAVIDAVLTDRDPSRVPLYQTQFSLQNVPVVGADASTIHVEAVPMDRVAAKNDLLFILEQRAGRGIDAELEYNTDLFREDTVRALGEDYVRLLEQLVETPEAQLSSLPRRTRLPAAHLAPLVAQLQAPPVPNPGDADLVTAFESAVSVHADAVAVRDAHASLTYAELDDRANAVAGELLARHLAAESPVGLLAGRSVHLVAAMLGILKAGGAYVPLATDHPVDRLRFMVAHAGSKILVCDRANQMLARAVASECGAAVLLIDEAVVGAGERSNAARPAIAPSQLAYIIYTSGSTGVPKGVMIEHRSVVNLVHALNDLIYRDIAGHATVALVASTVFDASVQQIFAALSGGHTLCLVSDDLKREGDELCEQLRRWRVDVCDCTPSLFAVMLRGGLAERCGGTLRHLLVGGEPLSTDLLRDLYRHPSAANIVVTNLYGPTECTVDDVAWTVRSTDPGIDRPEGPTVPIGRPMRNCRFVIVGDDGWPVTPGVVGELLLTGVCVGRGYVNDVALTSERFVAWPSLGLARCYRTGDLCRTRADGAIEFLGRNDDQVKILGHRIELAEVERGLRAHPQVRDISVQARMTSRGYRELAAYLVVSGDVTVAALREFAAERMPAYMIPSYFVPIDAMPLNASGKVARTALPDPEASARLLPGAAHREPRTATERAVLAIWTATLNLASAGVGDNYFASGGDSIKALQLASRLRDAGWRIAVRDIFRHPTIEQLSSHIDAAITPPPEADAFDSGVSPLGATECFFFEAYGASAHFNQALLLRPRRPLAALALRSACAALMAHHPMLRCRFIRQDGTWVREILGRGLVVPDVSHVDLRSSPDAEGDVAAHARAAQEAFHLERAPLWSAVLYDVPGGQRLLLTAHHLIIDGVSWRILLEDLERALGTLDGRAPRLSDRTASYPDWIAHQRQAVAAGVLEGEREYWQRHDAAAPPALFRQADRRVRRVALPEDLTRTLLTTAHAAYATEINDLLITAIARAWCAATGETRCHLTIEGHGREPLAGDLDLSATIGWFTSIYPLTIERAGGPLGSAIKSVKETLRGVPNKGAGYLALRYLSGADARMAPWPALAFNYLGRFDTSADGWFERAPEPPPDTASPDLPALWPLELTAAVVSGRMECALTYVDTVFDEGIAGRLLDRFIAELQNVIGHTAGRRATELTASDFDYAGLTEKGLEDFLGTI